MRHQMLELAGCYGTAAILVKCSKGKFDHLLVFCITHLLGHHVTELRKLNFARTISIILR